MTLLLIFKKSEISGIFGRNGSGKSKLLKITFGTINCNSITLKLNNREIPAKNIIRSNTVTYLPQDIFLPKYHCEKFNFYFFEDGDEQDKIFYVWNLRSKVRFNPIKYCL